MCVFLKLTISLQELHVTNMVAEPFIQTLCCMTYIAYTWFLEVQYQVYRIPQLETIFFIEGWQYGPTSSIQAS